MAIDRVRPLKIENPSEGGTEFNMLPTEVSPTADYVDVKGVAFESNDNRKIDLSVSGQIQFQDAIETTPITVRNLRTASANFFDNTSNGFSSTNVQSAIEEVNSFSRYFQYTESLGTTTNTSTTTYVNKLTLTTSNLASGEYIVSFQFTWTTANASREMDVRLRQNGSTVINSIQTNPRIQSRQLYNAWYKTGTISGVNTFTVDFKCNGTSTTLSLANARLMIWRAV